MTETDRTHRVCASCRATVALSDMRPYEYGLYGRSSFCRTCEDLLNANSGYPPGVYSPVFDLHGWRKGIADEQEIAVSDDPDVHKYYAGQRWAPKEGWLTVAIVIGVLVGVVVWQVLKFMI